jgi:hypothetical protein
MTEHVRYTRDDDLDVELLSARYVTHRFGLHTHATYVVGVVTGGAARFLSGGRGYVCPSGTIMLIEPEEAHTGGAGVAAGWSYRMLYPSLTLLERLTGMTPSFGPRVLVDRKVARALLAAHAAIEHGADELAKETLAVAAFGLLVRRHAGVYDRAPSPAACAWIVERVRGHVAEHFAERIRSAISRASPRSVRSTSRASSSTGSGSRRTRTSTRSASATRARCSRAAVRRPRSRSRSGSATRATSAGTSSAPSACRRRSSRRAASCRSRRAGTRRGSCTSSCRHATRTCAAARSA